jgi:hypothetical protein
MKSRTKNPLCYATILNPKSIPNNVNLAEGEGALPYKVSLKLRSKIPNAEVVKSSAVMMIRENRNSKVTAEIQLSQKRFMKHTAPVAAATKMSFAS